MAGFAGDDLTSRLVVKIILCGGASWLLQARVRPLQFRTNTDLALLQGPWPHILGIRILLHFITIFALFFRVCAGGSCDNRVCSPPDIWNSIDSRVQVTSLTVPGRTMMRGARLRNNADSFIALRCTWWSNYFLLRWLLDLTALMLNDLLLLGQSSWSSLWQSQGVAWVHKTALSVASGLLVVVVIQLLWRLLGCLTYSLRGQVTTAVKSICVLTFNPATYTWPNADLTLSTDAKGAGITLIVCLSWGSIEGQGLWFARIGQDVGLSQSVLLLARWGFTIETQAWAQCLTPLRFGLCPILGCLRRATCCLCNGSGGPT